MAACFQLIDKTTGKPVVLQQLDKMMCEHFGVECHPTEWMWRWYDNLGLLLATGNSLSGKSIEERLDAWYKPYPDDTPDDLKWNEDQKKKMMDVLEYLRERYTDRSWSER